jgi:hypothetical protein
MYLWSGEITVKSATDTTGVSQKTIVQLYQYMRNVCSTKLLNIPPDLGGPGVVVQIDESLFNHKSKYKRGRRPDKETWVFGIADTSTKPAVTYMQTVAGVVVQIDESLFNHKSKYQRGRRPDKETWVFGIADTSTKPTVTYMQTVAKRDATTLPPIIQKVVRPGSIVYSDEWRAY